MKIVAVGTTNPSKLRAVRESGTQWPELDGDVVGFAVKSGVSEQPLSLAETLKGATNRAIAAYWKSMDEAGMPSICVGIESGLISVEGTPVSQMDTYVFDLCACVLYDGKCVVPGLSGAWIVPSRPLQIMLDEMVDMNAAFKKCGLTDKDKLGNEEGAIAVLTGGKITRVDYTKQAIQMALVGWRNP